MRYMRRMQYRGDAGNHWFIGEGEQEGDAHYMAQVSGALADTFVDMVALTRPNNCYERCTRYDLQLTLPLPEEGMVARAANVLLGGDAGRWRTRGRPPRIGCHLNDDGSDTLNVGTRGDTTRFMRVYVKRTPEMSLLRVEVEFKGDLAEKCYNLHIKGDRAALSRALAGEMERFPESVGFLFKAHLAALTEGSERLLVDADPLSEDRTLRWLETTVLHAIGRMAGSSQRARLVDWMSSAIDVVAGQ